MYIKALPFFILLLTISIGCFSQAPDSTSKSSQLSGSASITNNGISLVPLFSLEKPAAVFDMSLSKSRVSFDPELAFSTSGRPWYFLLWLRYKIANTGKFRLTAGTHLGLNFKESVLKSGGDSVTAHTVERYIVGELVPNYFISKNTSVGVYYLISHGLDAGSAKAIQFFTVNANFTHVTLGDGYYMKANPQLYYLNIDGNDGFYCSGSLALAKDHFPLSISTLANKTIKTNISAGKSFTWNVSLTYAL
ncbi:MAG TPA: hypothetical protein VG738_02720 [Chitinophagaceae bacterium]|nr:hypothetical protein [Chitinophagaceae bacterium]